MQYVTVTPSAARYYRTTIRQSCPGTRRTWASKNNHHIHAAALVNWVYELNATTPPSYRSITLDHSSIASYCVEFDNSQDN
jgi:hypothetical protein